MRRIREGDTEFRGRRLTDFYERRIDDQVTWVLAQHELMSTLCGCEGDADVEAALLRVLPKRTGELLYGTVRRIHALTKRAIDYQLGGE